MDLLPRLGSERFELVRKLGEGGMGVVYEAVDRSERVHVALKMLRRLDADALYRLKSEFRHLRDIVHPNLVQLGDLVDTGRSCFLTMELVRGSDLISYVWNRSATAGSMGLEPTVDQPSIDLGAIERFPGGRPDLDEARLRRALPQLASAIGALHAADKVHRDIKPTNILVTDEHRLVVLDFGLAYDARHHHTGKLTVVGTVSYMAPEQALGNPQPASDWYSLGVVLFECLTGRLPFEGPALSVLVAKQRHIAPRASSMAGGVPDDLDQLCADLLSFTPEDRPTARGVLAALGATGGEQVRLEHTVSRVSASGPHVERGAERARLDAALDRAVAGNTPCVVVHGPSGVGKSSLTSRAMVSWQGRDDPPLVFSGRCHEGEAVPYRGLDEIVDQLSGHLRQLPHAEVQKLLPEDIDSLRRLFPVLGRVEAIATARRPRSDVHLAETRRRAFVALGALLRALSTARAVVVAVDDLQRAGIDTQRALTDLRVAARGARCLFVLTWMTRGDEVPDTGLTTDVELLGVGALSTGQATELATRLIADAGLEAHLDPAMVAAEGRCHPLFVGEIVRYAVAHGGDLPNALRLDQAITGRVKRLDEAQRHILELACVARAPTYLVVLAGAAQRNPMDVRRAAGALRIGSLLREGASDDRGARLEPYHGAIRAAVLARLDTETLRAHHVRLAIALETSEDAEQRPGVLIAHLEAAGEPRKAAEFADRAAARAAEALAFGQAAELIELAIRLGDYDRDKLRALQVRHGEALTLAGRGADAAAAFLAAAEGASTALARTYKGYAAHQLLIGGHIERGLEVVAAALADVGIPYRATPRAALASTLRRRAWLWMRGTRWRKRDHSEIPATDLAKIDICIAAAEGLGMVDNIRSTDFGARALLDALRAGEPLRIGRALALESVYIGSQGGSGIARGLELAAEARAIAAEIHDEQLSGYAAAAEGAILYFAGRYGDALERGNEAVDIFRRHPSGSMWEANIVPVRLFALFHSGRMAELEDVFEAGRRSAELRGDLYTEATLGRSCHIIWLLRDQPDEALRQLEVAAWTPPEHGFHLQHWYELEARGQIALYDGTAAALAAELIPLFEPLRRSLLLRIEVVRCVSTWLRGRLAIAAASRDAAYVGVAKKAARKLGRESARYAASWAALLRAGIHQLNGQRDRAIEHLRHAVSLADEREQALVAAAARHCLGDLARDEAEAESASEWARDSRAVRPDRLFAAIAPMPRGSSD